MAIFAGIRSRYHFKQGTNNFNSYIDNLDPMGPELPAAVQSFQKAVNLCPRFGEAWSSLAVAYYQWGMLATRLPYDLMAERKYAELESVSAEALASFELALHASSEALNLLQFTNSIGTAISHHVRGKTLVRIGDFPYALQEFTLALECDPSMSAASHNKSVVEGLLQGNGVGLSVTLL
jgi:tetratricopeptide (TPR) repeat protein